MDERGYDPGSAKLTHTILGVGAVGEAAREEIVDYHSNMLRKIIFALGIGQRASEEAGHGDHLP